MGLFSSVIHVRRVASSDVAAGLDAVMQDAGFVRARAIPLSGKAPERPDDEEGAAYAYGPLLGDWCTIVQVHSFAEDIELAQVGLALSETLDTYVLSLDLHDHDVFYYNLDHRGEPLDGYNSDPMYFEQEPMSEPDIEAQRHHPETFAPLVPPGTSPEALSTLLDRGWWRAHDRGELDENGVVREEAYDSDDYIDAEARMAAFGSLLRLHGVEGDYPYVVWTEAGADAWAGFTLVTYARA